MATKTSKTNKSRLDRIHQKFKSSVEDGKFYEASQMTRTLYFRYKMQGKHEDAEILLYESIITLLEHEQNESSFELARLLIKLYTEIKKPVDETSLGKITKIIQSSGQSSDSRKDFIGEALSWSTETHKHGHPSLHAAIANKYWQEKNHSEARQHFLHTTDGSQCAAFLVEYHVVAGFPGEIDLFVSQIVLQFLCLKNQLTANTTFYDYTSKHPGILRNTYPYKQPLLNFIAFLLFVVEKGTLEQYTILCEQYSPSIYRDPTYSQYLDQIGQIFFGLPPPEKPKSMFSGLIDNLMGSFIDGQSSSEQAEDTMEVINEDLD